MSDFVALFCYEKILVFLWGFGMEFAAVRILSRDRPKERSLILPIFPKSTVKQLPIIHNSFKQKYFFERLIMLLGIGIGQAFGAVAIVVIIVVLIRGLLLAGRLVRAVEKIAEKNDK